ncbi:hypothetical protein NBRC116583_37880 [Arenicella sp. 4NH20-0111]|uniref:hypothetical protein n=1 Tax=Arenicella sp. 4NH20-0111 TaxID=3127648 RepID=UPI00310C27AF
MKIVSTDNQCELTIENGEDEFGYNFCSLAAKIGSGTCEFTGCNNDVTFTNMIEFIKDLDSFILNRELEPKLEGTYGSYLLFKGTSTYVALTFKIGGAFCGTETFSYSITGTFEVAKEYLQEIVVEFKKYA